MEHKINISFAEKHFSNLKWTLHLRRCIRAVLKVENIRAACEINVFLTDDAGIKEINRAQRGIDKPTDVLSFPMFELEPDKLPEDWSEYQDPDTGLVPLGDMALSLERAGRQAEEFGHSVKREIGYLTIHSILHLLGYDHVDEGAMKKKMRAEEERVLAEIVLPR